MQHERTKVLFLITKSSWGGAQQYVYDLALSLPAESYEPVIIAGGEGELIERLKEAGLKVYPLPRLKRDLSLFGDIQTAAELFSIIRKEHPDVLHINSSKAGILGSIVGRLARVPKIIFTAHGWAFNEDRPRWQKFLITCAHYMTVMLSTKTIAVSEGVRNQLRWIGAQRKIVVIHPGRTLKDLRSKDDARGIIEMQVRDTSARLIDYHDDIWIGTIAELHPIKRLNRAIDAVSGLIKEFPALRYVIIHDGQMREALMQQVRDLGLEEHIFFTGTIADAARLLPAFDVFLLPSKSEAFGYVLVEAGQAGVPVVATNVGGIPDIIKDGVSGLLVSPDDTPALRSALRKLLIDPDLRALFAREHHERSMAFTAERMSAETRALYRDTPTASATPRGSKGLAI